MAIAKQLFKVHIFWEGHKNFAKSSTNFWPQYIQSKVSGRFRKILWPSQNIWTLQYLAFQIILLRRSELVTSMKFWFLCIQHTYLVFCSPCSCLFQIESVCQSTALLFRTLNYSSNVVFSWPTLLFAFYSERYLFKSQMYLWKALLLRFIQISDCL